MRASFPRRQSAASRRPPPSPRAWPVRRRIAGLGQLAARRLGRASNHALTSRRRGSSSFGSSKSMAFSSGRSWRLSAWLTSRTAKRKESINKLTAVRKWEGAIFESPPPRIWNVRFPHRTQRQLVARSGGRERRLDAQVRLPAKSARGTVRLSSILAFRCAARAAASLFSLGKRHREGPVLASKTADPVTLTMPAAALRCPRTTDSRDLPNSHRLPRPRWAKLAMASMRMTYLAIL